MKKYICFIAMVSLLAGCEKEKQNKDVNGGGFYLYSSINESNTRVSLEDNGTSAVVTKWEIGDKVAVQFYDGETGSDVYTFTVEGFEDENHKIAKMRSGEDIEIPDGADIYAWYPASTALNTEVDLSAGQDGTLETIHGKNVLATTTPTTYVDGQIVRLYFEHLTSIIKLELTKSDKISSVDPGLAIKGVNYGYKININPTGRTIELTPSETGNVTIPDYTVGTTTDPVYTLIAPGKVFGELDVAVNGKVYDPLARTYVDAPMGLSFNNDGDRTMEGGLTYIIKQTMSFAPPGAANFKGYLAKAGKSEYEDWISTGKKECYLYTQGRYRTWETDKGASDAIEIEKTEESVVINGLTYVKYNLILQRVPSLETMAAYIKVPAVVVSGHSPSLDKDISYVVLYDRNGDQLTEGGLYFYIDIALI